MQQRDFYPPIEPFKTGVLDTGDAESRYAHEPADTATADRLFDRRWALTLLDAVIIVSQLPDAICVMKASLMDNPLFGSAARLARYVRNDGILRIITGSCEALQQGTHLVLFPEGSRTVHFPVDPLQPTTGMIARRAGAPVQTVFLEFSTPYLGKAWPLFRKPTLPLHCRARLGRRFDAPTDHSAFTQTLEAYFRQELTPPVPTASHA